MSSFRKLSGLPLKQNIDLGVQLTLLLAALMGGASLLGLILPDSVYPSEALIQSYLANDLINLLLGLPILLVPIWLIRREVWAGLLCWPGAVLYVLYNSIAYLTGLPFGVVPLVHLVIVVLCVLILLDFLRGIDSSVVQNGLSGRIPERLGGWVLLAFGVLFIGRAMSEFSEMLNTGTLGQAPDLGVLVADLVLSTAWILGGIALIRRRPLGHASGLGLLFAGSMLFIGLIVFLLLQPLVTGAAFVLTDVVVVAVMGLVCFIPFGLYARGVISIK
jgi:hypothetical protein